MTEARVRCSFYIRTPAEGGFRYDSVQVRTSGGGGCLVTSHPPLVGDRVPLPVGTFVVVARSWLYPAWGSVEWPHGENAPRVGPRLELLLEDAEELFVDEISSSDDDES